MKAAAILVSTLVLLPVATQAADHLKMDDKASLWPGASMGEKVDFTDRMGKSMSKLSPDLDNRYFMQCLEETANIGDTKDLTLSDMVRTCVSLRSPASGDEN